MKKMTIVYYVASDDSYWNNADLCKKYDELIADKEGTDEEILDDLIERDLELEENITYEEME